MRSAFGEGGERSGRTRPTGRGASKTTPTLQIRSEFKGAPACRRRHGFRLGLRCHERQRSRNGNRCTGLPRPSLHRRHRANRLAHVRSGRDCDITALILRDRHGRKGNAGTGTAGVSGSCACPDQRTQRCLTEASRGDQGHPGTRISPYAGQPFGLLRKGRPARRIACDASPQPLRRCGRINGQASRCRRSVVGTTYHGNRSIGKRKTVFGRCAGDAALGTTGLKKTIWRCQH